MTQHAPVIDSYADEVAEGQCTAIAALVLALDEACILPRGRYAEILHQLWLAMPDHQAVGGAGATVECVLAMVGKGARYDATIDDAPYGRHEAACGNPVGMAATIWPVPEPDQASPEELAWEELALEGFGLEPFDLQQAA